MTEVKATCILLTGYTDKQNASHALNEADIYQYMEKPWDNDHLLLVLRNGFQEKDLPQQLREKIRVLGRRITEHSELSEAFRPRICAPASGLSIRTFCVPAPLFSERP